MKKRLLIALMSLCCMMFLFAGCGGSGDSGEADDSATAVQKEITDVDENLGHNLPLGVDSIVLLEDGTLLLEKNDE